MKIFYHVTSQKNLQSILAVGLKAKKPNKLLKYWYSTSRRMLFLTDKDGIDKLIKYSQEYMYGFKRWPRDYIIIKIYYDQKLLDGPSKFTVREDDDKTILANQWVSYQDILPKYVIGYY